MHLITLHDSAGSGNPLGVSGCTDISIITTNDFLYMTQLFIFLGSIILAAIVLKLSLYGIFRLILILSPKAYIIYTFIIFTIGVLTIVYANQFTIRNLLSLNMDALGNISISLTNMALFLTISVTLIIGYFTLANNKDKLTPNN
ncbi:hypothetical protein IEQ34_024598 [Dendrobium chrysotoxum]|uniref:NADH:quinone oxidoreductase/Mrp antiporter transmembrane domain-containing protein n=1 Tax=Dendrobium chrysotoxum TaxID=161865 RepID=A0AAV7FJC3_DENCH|nr:hypothetical protein IEQ34_024598 [Dendrobium chrysotoxum]